MRFLVYFTSCAVSLLLLTFTSAAQAPSMSLPTVAREFRAAWVATVDNIDWPSKPGLPVEQQKIELLAILDRAVALKLNALVWQIRPACDALYDSKLEPWSDYLTGTMGQPPDPYYDPLALIVEEAHKRGIELHVWFNPYRAHHPSSKSEISANHISKTKPELVKTYGKHLWLDPGEPAVQEHSLAVIMDVVRRYDIDGVHMDDYFYPYKERDAQNKIIEFPDEASWQKYVTSGGTLNRDDWRRNNVDTFVEKMYSAIKAEKRWVKVGISPFGIYRPGYPAQIKGFDQYTELYADARKWFVNGWLDYFTPQLYWPIEQTAQSYSVLLNWWASQNEKRRHLWPGNFTSRVGEGTVRAWPPEEIVYQIKTTRGQAGATGNVHFSMKALMQNRSGLSEMLSSGVYATPAIVPASSWLDDAPPGKPELTVALDEAAKVLRGTWKPVNGDKIWLWVVRTKIGKEWMVEVKPGTQMEVTFPMEAERTPEVVAITAVDRTGNESPVALWQRPPAAP
jgi:uncharacterized lipoprotein YddW (UPF0748 family)